MLTESLLGDGRVVRYTAVFTEWYDVCAKEVNFLWLISYHLPVPAGKVDQVPRTCTAGLRKKLKQETTTKMGSRGSDTSPRRDAVWHQLYSASYIYTEKREKDKTVDIFFLVGLYILQTVTRNLESMGMAPCYYFLHQITFPCAEKFAQNSRCLQ